MTVSAQGGGNIIPSGGSGGGAIFYKGDMVMKVEKFVSTDGKEYKDASEQTTAIVVPENETITLYNKVRLTNLGPFTASNIKFRHNFDPGNSDMQLKGSVRSLEGATYNKKFDYIQIDEVSLKQPYEFSYVVVVEEMGQSDQFATDSVQLLDWGSTLPKGQDGMTYTGIGDETMTYLVAGRIPAWAKGQTVSTTNNFLKITVASDKGSAAIGDEVTFTVTLENTAGRDLTGLIVAHDYAENALSVLKTFGGRDNGKEVQWKRAILRPDEKVTYQMRAKVNTDAPANSTIRGVSRALVSEFAGGAQVENKLDILDGAVSMAPDKPFRLAQTGPATLLLLLIASILAYFGYQELQRRRYQNMKAAALRPL